MAIKIKNKDFVLVIESAGERYKGSRFDWNGTITQVYFRGIPLLGQEKKLFHRNARIYGRGLHNEFGINDCIGYDEAGADGLFPKLGTGWLKKDDKPYFFYTQYQIEPLRFSLKRPRADIAEFYCESGEKNGYAYEYKKTITLLADGFSIDYELKNVGQKSFSTTEYVHNFICPGNGIISKDIKLEFGWQYDVQKLAEIREAEALETDGKTITFRKEPAGEFYVGGIFDAKIDGNAEASWTVKDAKHNLLIKETDSFVPDAVNLWGHSKSISPEMFFRFTAAPQETVKWQRLYTVKTN